MKPPATMKEKLTKVSRKEAAVVVKPPSNKEVLEALEVLTRAVHHRGTDFNMQYEYERCINGIVESNKTQTNITNFLISNM